jgi:hypothetical protein
MSEQPVVEKNRSIADRLAAARLSMNALAHDARNQHHKYGYTSSEKIIGAATASLAEQGLSVVPISSNVESMGNGCKVSQVWHLIGEGDEPIAMERQHYCEAGKGRPLDKEISGASTVNLAYLLRDLCGIERSKGNGEETRPDERDDRSYQPQSKQRFYDKPESQSPQEDQEPAPSWPKLANDEPSPPAGYDNNIFFQKQYSEALSQRGIDFGHAKMIAGAEARNAGIKDYASANPSQREALVKKVMSGAMDGFKSMKAAESPDEPAVPVIADQQAGEHEADENACLALWMEASKVDSSAAMAEMDMAIQRTTRSQLTFAGMSAEQMKNWRDTLGKHGKNFIEQWHEFATAIDGSVNG